jgi:hypothetical protein
VAAARAGAADALAFMRNLTLAAVRVDRVICRTWGMQKLTRSGFAMPSVRFCRSVA